jgi:chromate reductase
MITVISATNRKDSNTIRVAKIAQSRLEASGVKTQFLDLATLPRELFVPEHYWNTPPSFEPFQKMVLDTDGILVVVPEYNGSFPGVFKYFIDLLKFPESLQNMPVAFVGVAAGVFGALRSIEQLEHIFHYRGAHLFNRFVLLPKVEEKLNKEKTEIVDEFTKKLFNIVIADFPKFAAAIKQTRT